MFCPPEFSNTSGGGGSSGGTDSGSGSDGDPDNECSTKTAQVCSTVCVAGSGCDFDCSTTTGCSATASSTKVVGTPAPGVAITMNRPWTTQYGDPDKVLSSAISLESVISSMFGTLTVIEGLGPTTTTATGPAPTSGSNPERITLYYYHTNVDGEAQWEIYEGAGSGRGCPETQTPDFVKKDGSFAGIHNGDSGFKAYGKLCKYEGTNLPTGEHGVKAGKFVCGGYRDAACYTGNGDEGTCQYGYTGVFSVMYCEW